ncbi:glycosyltransferase [uncultured Vagococcus sp.]|uniref:glycosyltransferase n=1 Tax=uncultured Vagococcus sp. TaxID=189676 RepID=UPI0028D42366|nr:glycosyltransferase [uncultured Vagococcus sp.]
MIDFNKKVLVISNNPFSTTQNNGKTLYSFFLDYKLENVSQLYFSEETPDIGEEVNFFKITDKQVLKKKINRNSLCGVKVEYNLNARQVIHSEVGKTKKILKNHFFRLVREKIWKNNWKSKELDNWLAEVNPDIIFFCAGDFGSGYDITNYISKKFETDLIVYMTDDYILPRSNASYFAKKRQEFIKKKVQITLNETDLFYTISKEMSQTYEELFKVKSDIILNMAEIPNHKKESEKKTILKLVYAGGLHLGRDNVLVALINSIVVYNRTHNQKAFLEVYSNTILTEKEKKKFCIENSSHFFGQVNKKELDQILLKSDILVHVESYDSKQIEATLLSISTKIPEYLAVEKPILAIGPEQISSMRYLSQTSFCIYDTKDLELKVEKLLEDSELRDRLAENSKRLFFENHDRKVISEEFLTRLTNVKRRLGKN